MGMQEKAYQILFVDHDEDVCQAMVERLSPLGYRVISACNQYESLCLAKIGPFDLYLFGELFPEASRMELCCQIHEFDAETPVLFYTNPANEAGRKSLEEYDIEALEQAIARLLPEDEPKPAVGSQPFRPGRTRVKVAIIGLGNCLDLDPVRRYVKLLPPQAVVMTNDARGIGLAAKTAARTQGLKIHAIPAEWSRFGRKAGWQRNRQLVECADRVALFWDQRNSEALSLLRFAQKLHKPIEFYVLQGDQVFDRSAPNEVPAPLSN